MKYFFRVMLVLLIASGIIFAYSYNYRKEKNADNIVLTTQKIGKTTNKTDSRILVAENEESGYKIYKDNGSIILTRDGVEQNFDNWYASMSSRTPELYFSDFDEDGEKELLIIMISDIINYYSGKSDYFNTAVLVETETNENGETVFKTITAGVDSWKAPFTSAIKCEMNQLIQCKKIIQFVMDDISDDFIYDESTGISSNEYVYYAKAIKQGDGKYAELERWQRGASKYSVSEDGKIKLDIAVLAFYKDQAKPQIIGNIDMTMHIRDGKFDILPKSISFIADEIYYCQDPRDTAEESWLKTIKNSSQPASTQDTSIDWIEADFSVEYYNNQTIGFSGMTSEIKNVERVEINEGSLTLFAKEGYKFSDRSIINGNFSVTANVGPDNSSYDIAYTCEIKDIDGENALIIYFDKTYDKEDLPSFTVKYGA